MHALELEIYKRALDEVALILTTDKDGKITYVNDKYCVLSKYSREELVGQHNGIIESEYHNKEFYDNMYGILNQGRIFKGKFKNKAKDGSTFWTDATIIPFFDKSGELYQFLTIRFDISDKINEVGLKEEFLAGVSHEIRTPLHGMLSMVDLLSETELNQEQKEYIKLIKITANNLGNLVNDLLDIFRLESGKLQFDNIPFNIKDFVHSKFETLNLREIAQEVKFIKIVDHRISELLLCDPKRIKQILFNLLDNAIKFTEKGTITLKLDLIEEDDNHQLIEFMVIDTGIGFPANQQGELFDNFINSEEIKYTRIFGGTGLGLNIVKNLIKVLNGTLSMKSIEGEGTVFSFRLEFRKVPLVQSNAKAEIEIIKPQETYRILIAEDEMINQMIYKKQLTKFNYAFELAEDGFETLAMLKKEAFDLLLLDMQMPGMNGDEVLQKIRNEFPEPIKSIPVICVSASVHPALIQSVLEAGANDYMSKPYKEADLFDIINKTLHKTRDTKKEISLVVKKEKIEEIDLDTIKQFTDGDDDFLVELLEYFHASTPDVLKSMQQNYNTNSAELPKQLHKYRSQVSLLGLKKLTELTLVLENAFLKADTFGLFQSDFEQLIEQSNDLLDDVPVLINKIKSSNTL